MKRREARSDARHGAGTGAGSNSSGRTMTAVLVADWTMRLRLAFLHPAAIEPDFASRDEKRLAGIPEFDQPADAGQRIGAQIDKEGDSFEPGRRAGAKCAAEGRQTLCRGSSGPSRRPRRSASVRAPRKRRPASLAQRTRSPSLRNRKTMLRSRSIGGRAALGRKIIKSAILGQEQLRRTRAAALAAFLTKYEYACDGSRSIPAQVLPRFQFCNLNGGALMPALRRYCAAASLPLFSWHRSNIRRT